MDRFPLQLLTLARRQQEARSRKELQNPVPASLAATNPLGRIGDPEEKARA